MRHREYVIQLIVSDDSAPNVYRLLRSAETIGADMERATNGQGLPIPTWEVTIWGRSLDSVKRRLQSFAEQVGFDLSKAVQL